jgi:hypothetical protein
MQSSNATSKLWENGKKRFSHLASLRFAREMCGCGSWETLLHEIHLDYCMTIITTLKRFPFEFDENKKELLKNNNSSQLLYTF